MKARIKETDMSVPTRRGPWWYYSRTEEGKDYGIHCRRPARGPQELPPAGEPGEEEQILLDENVLAEGSDYFAVGSAAVSHDHRWLAYSTDRPRRREVRAAVPAPGAPASRRAPESVPETGYGLAWSAAADYVFYVRMDEAQRPFQLWRHELGTDPAGDVLVVRGARPALLARDRHDPGRRVGAGRPAQHQHAPSGSPSRPPTPWPSPASSCPRSEGVEYAVEHLTPAGGGGWFLVLTNDEAQDFRVLAAPDDDARRAPDRRLARGDPAPSRDAH